jgi:hypothetical protein
MRLNNSIGLVRAFYCEMVRYVNVEKPKASLVEQFTLADWGKASTMTQGSYPHRSKPA